MQQRTPTYWSYLGTVIPGRYRTRTRLTGRYVLQVSGREGGRRHGLVLYRMTPAGAMRRAWSKTFRPSRGTTVEAARISALEILEQGPCGTLPYGNKLRESVRDLLDELTTGFGKEAE